MLNDFDCCGDTVQLGGLPLGVTVPFFILIFIEIVMLILSVKYNLTKTRADEANEEAARKADTSWSKFLGASRRQKLVNGLLIINPFFGFMVAWLLLYQSNKKQCFIVLGFEAGSLVLHWLSIYFEGQPQTRISMAFHMIPLIPFVITVIVIIVYVKQGGVCYLVDEDYFWYDGCQVCSDGTPPGDNTACPDGSQDFRGTYCGEDGSFCFFKY
jgi:hypothetical protein